MTLQQLRAFLAVVEEGSFRGAARRLAISQAGLTTAIQALERSLGQTLLQRSLRGATLTAAGQRLLPRAQLIERETHRAMEEATSADDAAGELHVGVGPTATALLLARVVPDFRARFPNVSLHLTSGLHERIRPALQQGLLDMALVALPDGAEWPGQVRTRLFRSLLTVVGREGHPLAGARQLAELQNADWVLMGSPGGPGGTVTRFFDEQGLPPPRVAATCETFTEVAALLSGTDWLALIPQSIVQRSLIGRPVASLALVERAPGYETFLMRPRQLAPTAAAEAFATMCVSWSRLIAKGAPGLMD
ncbi:LysR family transcriptional regulator [Hydrogenophaga crassostreae]|uniref:LysR family transcriptional regulator n=1 Tax=Hydrogenophaga crassostreae TaxID=1763535 RepID=A0A162W134_9BURK|nr:LysR family transcriptional regulator [Hydrogenophaga crassostreae]AOW14182.1 LysR family transcriptional regulator [Hydrogenophaga crassostreae]OAD42888.1 LysR family transcriptional regulator [Hydrogenophaga crassostreae]